MGMHSRSRIPSQVLARLAKEGKSRKWTEAEKAAFAKSAPSGAILEEEFLKVTRELEKDGMFKASMLHTTYTTLLPSRESRARILGSPSSPRGVLIISGKQISAS